MTWPAPGGWTTEQLLDALATCGLRTEAPVVEAWSQAERLEVAHYCLARHRGADMGRPAVLEPVSCARLAQLEPAE